MFPSAVEIALMGDCFECKGCKRTGGCPAECGKGRILCVPWSSHKTPTNTNSHHKSDTAPTSIIHPPSTISRLLPLLSRACFELPCPPFSRVPSARTAWNNYEFDHFCCG